MKTKAGRFTLVFAIALAGCGGDDSDNSDGAPMCVQIDPNCVAAFPTTWNEVYKNLIAPRCGGSAGGQCHGPDGKKAGLVLYPQAQAYDDLFKGSNGRGARVIPMDAACSVLTERLETDQPARWMPYGGQRLSPTERCTIEKWIAEGAKP